MPKIDDAAYQDGRDMFANRVTIRSMVEAIPESHVSREEGDETREFSRVVGYADALLDLLRASKPHSGDCASRSGAFPCDCR